MFAKNKKCDYTELAFFIFLQQNMQKLILIAASSALVIPALFATEDATMTTTSSGFTGTVVSTTGTANTGAIANTGTIGSGVWYNCMSGNILERKDTRAEARAIYTAEVKRLTTEHKEALKTIKGMSGTTSSGSVDKKAAKKAADVKLREGMKAAQKTFNAALKNVRQDRREDRRDCRKDIREDIKTEVKEMKDAAKEKIEATKAEAKAKAEAVKAELKEKLEIAKAKAEAARKEIKERSEALKEQREAAKAKYEELKKAGKIPAIQMGSGMMLPPVNTQSTTESGSTMAQ